MTETQATRYFWVEGGSNLSIDEYHWLADCPWLAVEVSHGASTVSSDRPPKNARDGMFVGIALSDVQPIATLAPALHALPPETTLSGNGDGRWLCAVCREYMPQAEPVRLKASQEPCATCYCPRRVHELEGILQADCGYTWPSFPTADGGPVWLRCRCDGYRPLGA